MYSYTTFADAYQDMSSQLLKYGEEHSPRGAKTKEIRNFTYTLLNSFSNLYQNDVRSVPKKYLANELIWYLSGSNNVRFISKNAKLWNRIKNPDGETVNSAYGHLLFNDPNEYGITEWNWAKQNLADDNDTRQAVIRFNKPKHSWFGNRDFVCTFYGIFLIRNNKLHLTIHQRSCDIMTGLTFDVPFFTLLNQLMVKELNSEFGLNIEVGEFTHVINSLHVYEKDFEKLHNMIDAKFTPDSLPEISPLAREYVDGIIPNNGIIPYSEFEKRIGKIKSDKLLNWCFQNSNWQG